MIVKNITETKKRTIRSFRMAETLEERNILFQRKNISSIGVYPFESLFGSSHCHLVIKTTGGSEFAIRTNCEFANNKLEEIKECLEEKKNSTCSITGWKG
uniref:Uncharacterized protein n=1 Tax=Marseillevirus LCMAC101 TaxID=2506602 RepID=A0A481YRY0_9VIRU|nr:MAG: hypothetical protein LCMAC101_02820 [Marseillevirus LCMAC101]